MILTMISAIEDESDKAFMLNLYDSYYALIKKTIYKVLHNSRDVEDLINETFLKLFEKLSDIREINCHKRASYIVNISKNNAIDFIKHRDVAGKHEFYGAESDISEEIHEDKTDFEEDIISRLDAETLCEAALKIPEKQKHLLYCKYFLRMSDNEIAKVMGLSVNSIPQYVKRARIAAKHLVEKESETHVK